jgi:hypothetical protein
MNKSRHILLNLTEEQYALLVKKARASGFSKESEYVRFVVLTGDTNGIRL